MRFRAAIGLAGLLSGCVSAAQVHPDFPEKWLGRPLSQFYWIWEIWSATGVFFNLLTVMCLAWIGLVIATIALGAAVEA